jgi:hypothetical protein
VAIGEGLIGLMNGQGRETYLGLILGSVGRIKRISRLIQG